MSTARLHPLSAMLPAMVMSIRSRLEAAITARVSFVLAGLVFGLVSTSRVSAAEAFDATRVGLLPGSSFHERQELHRRGFLTSFDCDKLLFHYRALVGLPLSAGVTSGYFDQLEGKPGDDAGVVVPYYTVHKIMAGLLDAHRYLGNTQALEIAVKMAG